MIISCEVEKKRPLEVTMLNFQQFFLPSRNKMKEALEERMSVRQPVQGGGGEGEKESTKNEKKVKELLGKSRGEQEE